MSIYNSSAIIANLYDANQGPHENRALQGAKIAHLLRLFRNLVQATHFICHSERNS